MSDLGRWLRHLKSDASEQDHFDGYELRRLREECDRLGIHIRLTTSSDKDEPIRVALIEKGITTFSFRSDTLARAAGVLSGALYVRERERAHRG